MFECNDGEEGVPKSEHTTYDYDKAWNSMWDVYEKYGAIVASLVDRNGGQYSNLVRQAKLKQQIGILLPTIFSDGSDNEFSCSNITDGSEELSIDERS